MTQSQTLLTYDIQDVRRLGSLLGERGQDRSVPAAELLEFPASTLAAWCKFAGLHQIVTDELLEFMRWEIGEGTAIEIGAGRGILGHLLKICQTDSRLVETHADVRRYYDSIQERTDPLPEHVQTFEALAAVTTFHPDTVIGAWITQWGDGRVPNSSPYGVDEEAILQRCRKYVHIGNKRTHATKRLVQKYPPREIAAPWLMSRSVYPQDNVIYIWEGR